MERTKKYQTYWKDMPAGEAQRKARWDQEQLYRNAVEMFSPRLERELLKKHIPEARLNSVLDDLEEGEGLYIHGPVGSGKTYLAAALLMQVKKRQYITNDRSTCKYISVPQFFQSLKAGFKDNSSTDLVEEIQQAGWLVMDDFGLTKLSDWSIITIYNLVNYRYDQLMPTIYTSNFTLDEIANHFGDERVSSRIAAISKIMKVSQQKFR